MRELPSPIRLTPSDVAAHGTFVRALAANLVRDPHLADDVAQETWAAALENAPPSRASVRSWLAAVARNAARKFFRGESRRARREEIAARPEGLPSAAEAAQREAMLRRVVDAVLSLEEPYRATVLARYYEGLSVTEIAERAGAPLATVHSRLRRAHERLRERLDSESGGDRSAWCASLASLAGLPRGAPVPVPISAPLALGAIAAGGAALIGWVALDGGSPQATLPKPAPLSATAPIGAAKDSRLTTTADPATSALATSARPAARDDAPEDGAAEMTAAILDGEVVDSAGSPVAGAAIWARVRFDLTSLAATDGDGRFRFPLPEATYSLHARAPGFAPSLAFEIEPGDDGPQPMRFVLPGPGATVTGLVTDSAGAAIAGAEVRVGAPESRARIDAFGQVARAPALVTLTDADGRFRADDVEPGRLTVWASAPGYAPTHDRSVATSAGETAAVELRLERGATLAGIVRDASGAPIVNGHVCLVPPESVARLVRCATGEDGSYRLDSLEPGHLSFHAADFAGTEHARTTLGIERGEEATWNPILGQESADGAAAIAGRVVDEGGLPLAGVVVSFTPPDAENLILSQGRTDGAGRFVLTGHPNRDGDLAVFERDLREDGNAFPLAVARGIRPGADDVVIGVTADERPASFIAGTLVGPGDEPIGDAVIHARRDGSDRQVEGRPDRETGAFRLGPLPTGRYRLTIATRSFGQRRLHDVETARGEVIDLGLVRFEVPGLLATTVRWERSAPRGSLEFSLHRDDSDGWVEIQTAGALTTPLPLSPGSYRLAATGSHVRESEYRFEIRSGETTAIEIVPVLGTRHRVRFVTEADAPPLGRVRVVVRRYGESTVLYEGEFALEPGADPVVEIDVDPALFELEATSDAGLRGTAHGSLGPTCEEWVIEVPMRR